MIGVFIPLILLNEGLRLWQVCAFYIGYGLFKLTLNYPIFKVINRRGPIAGLTVGNVAGAIYLLSIAGYTSTGAPEYLYLSALMLAVMNSFLWNSQHLHISTAMDESRKSRDLAMIANLGRLAGILSPLIGGAIAVTLGGGWLASLAAVVTLLSIVPLLRLEPRSSHIPEADLKYSMAYAPVRDLVGNVGFNAHTLVGVMVWPLYLAVFIPSFSKIGYIDAISTAVAVVVLHFTARRSDNGKNYNVLVEGTAMSSVVHMARVFASSNPFTITLISSFYDIALSYQANPWTSIYYAHAKKRGIRYILSMEIAGDLAYVAVWGVLGAIAYATESNAFFNVAFAIAAVAAWLVLLISRDPLLRESRG